MFAQLRSGRGDGTCGHRMLRYTSPELHIVDDLGQRPLRQSRPACASLVGRTGTLGLSIPPVVYDARDQDQDRGPMGQAERQNAAAEGVRR